MIRNNAAAYPDIVLYRWPTAACVPPCVTEFVPTDAFVVLYDHTALAPPPSVWFWFARVPQ